MSVISLGDFAKDLEPLTGVWVDQGKNRYKEEYSKIFKVVSDNVEYFEDQMYSTLGMPLQKDEGDAASYTKMSQRWGVRYQPTGYALGINITHEMLRGGRALNIAQIGLKAIGAGFTDLKNTVAMNVLNNAFDSNYKMDNGGSGGDGKELCATDHPTDNGTTANELATPASLSVASLKQSFIEMKSMTDLYGNPVLVMPKKLLIPRALIFDAENIQKAQGAPGSADNDINSWKSVGLVDEVIVSDWLTSSTKHFLLTDQQERGLIFFDREKEMTFRDRDFDTMNAKFMVYSSFGVGWTDYNCVFGNAI